MQVVYRADEAWHNGVLVWMMVCGFRYGTYSVVRNFLLRKTAPSCGPQNWCLHVLNENSMVPRCMLCYIHDEPLNYFLIIEQPAQFWCWQCFRTPTWWTSPTIQAMRTRRANRIHHRVFGPWGWCYLRWCHPRRIGYTVCGRVWMLSVYCRGVETLQCMLEKIWAFVPVLFDTKLCSREHSMLCVHVRHSHRSQRLRIYIVYNCRAKCPMHVCSTKGMQWKSTANLVSHILMISQSWHSNLGVERRSKTMTAMQQRKWSITRGWCFFADVKMQSGAPGVFRQRQ